MSRQPVPTARPTFASRTNFEALAVDSGEESSDDEPSTEPEAPPASASTNEPVKLTKTAQKKATKAARLAKKAQVKAARAAGDALSGVDTSDVSRPATPAVELETSNGHAAPEEPEPLLAPPAPVNGKARPVEPVQPPEPPVPAPARPVVEEPAPVEVPKPIPEIVVVPAKKEQKPVNGSSLKLPVAQPPVVLPPAPISSEDAERTKKRQNALTRTLWTFIMIGGFIGLLLMGHAYMILLVMLCQTLVYREVTALFGLTGVSATSDEDEDPDARDPWSKTLNWYFFAVTNYFLYGESIIYYFKHVVFADAGLTTLANKHRFISFTLYIIGFMGFVGSLKRGYLKQQFGLFCWVHMSLLLFVVTSHFIVNNILEGLIWFWVPASLVICNDVFAYIWGITVGRTPLIKLSPKKTVEGFVGAFFSTLVFSLVWGTYFARFDYMICPVQDLGVSAFSSVKCTPNPAFVWREAQIPAPVSVFLSTLLGRAVATIPYMPYQFHLLSMACFASLVAPFGGFFASGFKRAFNIKDFGHSIPGHGGMTDRMDCQFLMGVFTYVYYSSLIRQNHVTVGGLLQLIVSGLTVEEQLQLMADLRHYIEGQGIVIPF